MNIKIRIVMTSGETAEYSQIMSFRFVKEAYTPYTSLSVSMIADNNDYGCSAAEIFMYAGDTAIHHGFIDTVEYTKSFGKNIVSITSRGFTAMLCQNQLEPGLVSGISIDKLIDGYYTLPYVTHENNDSSGYIYVKSNSSIWDGVVNLSYKLCGTYPYIRGTNCVRITAETNPSEFSYNQSSEIETGSSSSLKRVISDFNMSDINDSYGEFTLTDDEIVSRKIVRHKVFELDRQFLYNPQEALEYRDKYVRRGSIRKFCRYSGYNGEDLMDKVTFEDVSGARICRIEITGDSKGIFTELSVYNDGFYNL